MFPDVSQSVSQTLRLLCFILRQSVCQSARHWDLCFTWCQSVCQSARHWDLCFIWCQSVCLSARHWDCYVLPFANKSVSQPDIETVMFYISPISLSVSQKLRLLCFTFRQSVCQSARHWDCYVLHFANQSVSQPDIETCYVFFAESRRIRHFLSTESHFLHHVTNMADVSTKHLSPICRDKVTFSGFCDLCDL